VTEAEWLSSTSPEAMLAFLRKCGRASERKHRLFACAAVRSVWHLLTDNRSRRALELVEAAADGLADSRELRAAVLAADQAAYRANRAEDQARAARRAAAVAQRAVAREADRGRTPAAEPAVGRAAQVARQAVRRAEQLTQRAETTRGTREAARAARLCVRAAWYRNRGMSGSEISWQQAVEAAVAVAGDPGQEEKFHCHLLRDIVGPLPFRPVVLDPSLLKWNDRLVVGLAQAIYEERRWGDMPVLADALLDAGCDSEDMLAHCHEQGTVHVRGCWVLDLLLGKE